MKRGSIYWINLEPASPPEFGKIRPGLVISNTEHNLRLPSVVIVPLSTQSPEIWPLRLELKIPKQKNSYVVIPGMRQVSKTRLHELIGQAPEDFMDYLNSALEAYLKDN